jgi:hypothetical protein
MPPAVFKTKWAKFSGKESAAYAEHFNALCRMLGVPTPVECNECVHLRLTTAEAAFRLHRRQRGPRGRRAPAGPAGAARRTGPRLGRAKAPNQGRGMTFH